MINFTADSYVSHDWVTSIYLLLQYTLPRYLSKDIHPSRKLYIQFNIKNNVITMNKCKLRATLRYKPLRTSWREPNFSNFQLFQQTKNARVKIKFLTKTLEKRCQFVHVFDLQNSESFNERFLKLMMFYIFSWELTNEIKQFIQWRKTGSFLNSFISDFTSFYTTPFILGTIALWVINPCASFLLITAIAVVCIYFVTLSMSVFEA